MTGDDVYDAERYQERLDSARNRLEHARDALLNWLDEYATDDDMSEDECQNALSELEYAIDEICSKYL